MSRRQYSDEFKHEAMAMVDAGASVEAVARSLGMPPGSLWNWITRSHRSPDPAPPTDAGDPLTIAALQRRVADLEQEVEFLGKASAYFASKRQRSS